MHIDLTTSFVRPYPHRFLMLNCRNMVICRTQIWVICEFFNLYVIPLVFGVWT